MGKGIEQQTGAAVMRELVVYLDRTLVGMLFEESSLWGFEYDSAWLAHGYNIIPGLLFKAGRQLDGATTRPVQWFFDNLLPEEQARTLLEKEARAFSLLTAIGHESAGAFTLLTYQFCWDISFITAKVKRFRPQRFD